MEVGEIIVSCTAIVCGAILIGWMLYLMTRQDDIPGVIKGKDAWNFKQSIREVIPVTKEERDRILNNYNELKGKMKKPDKPISTSGPNEKSQSK